LFMLLVLARVDHRILVLATSSNFYWLSNLRANTMGKKDKKKDKKKRNRDRSESPLPKKKARKARVRNSSTSSSSSTDVDVGAKGSRKVYSLREIETLVAEYTKHFITYEANKLVPDTASSRAKPAVERRDESFKKIAVVVSEVDGYPRPASSCQEKIRKLKSALKKEGKFVKWFVFLEPVARFLFLERLRNKYTKQTGNLSEEQVTARIKKKMNQPLMDPEIREIVLPLLSDVSKSGISGGVDTSQGKNFLILDKKISILLNT
jgi:hypothetical protein